MKTYAGGLKKGEFVIHQGEICQVVKTEFYSPGKGSALMHTKLKNVQSGKTQDYAFKSNEDVETVEVNSIEMQFMYKDDDSMFFMNEQTYEQVSVPTSMAEGFVQYLKEGDKLFVFIQDDKALSVRPPMSVRLKVIQTEDAVKGDTVNNARKSATLETGAIVMVPLFVKAGETITLNPETAEYTGRA